MLKISRNKQSLLTSAKNSTINTLRKCENLSVGTNLFLYTMLRL